MTYGLAALALSANERSSLLARGMMRFAPEAAPRLPEIPWGTVGDKVLEYARVQQGEWTIPECHKRLKVSWEVEVATVAHAVHRLAEDKHLVLAKVVPNKGIRRRRYWRLA